LLRCSSLSRPELEDNRIVLNATKQAPAPQAPKTLGRASHQRGRVRARAASSPLPLRGRGRGLFRPSLARQGHFPQHCALQIFGRRGAAVSGSLAELALQGGLIAGWESRARAHLPRPHAPCALPRTPPGGGCWVLAVVPISVAVCGFVLLIRPGAVAPALRPRCCGRLCFRCCIWWWWCCCCRRRRLFVCASADVGAGAAFNATGAVPLLALAATKSSTT
jgi:hypothetical protein